MTSGLNWNGFISPWNPILHGKYWNLPYFSVLHAFFENHGSSRYAIRNFLLEYGITASEAESSPSLFHPDLASSLHHSHRGMPEYS